MKVMVEVSARHAHLSDADLSILFGPDAGLTNKKDLSQPAQFACNERIEVIGPKGSIIMSILGPTRKETQVELSLTDARKLGLMIPIRESGDLAGSAPCTIKGPQGSVELTQGAIAAKRHIHFSTDEAKDYGISDKQVVSVKVDFNGRALTFGDVVCRVNPAYALAMHIDTDESNAAALPGTVDGEIII